MTQSTFDSLFKKLVQEGWYDNYAGELSSPTGEFSLYRFDKSNSFGEYAGAVDMGLNPFGVELTAEEEKQMRQLLAREKPVGFIEANWGSMHIEFINEKAANKWFKDRSDIYNKWADERDREFSPAHKAV